VKPFPLAGPALLAAACLATAAPDPRLQEPANLVVNGGFEEGPDVAAYKPLNPGSADVRGWVVTRGQIDYIASHWRAAEGKRSLDLHGSPGYGGVKQTFRTQKGRRYRVTFSLAGTPLIGKLAKRTGVSAAGQKGEFAFDAAGKTLQDMGWETRVWEFTAAADETTLEFFTLESEDPNCGPALDDVSVVALLK
jgi:choice-of-anchor C domain-containing protein